MLTNSVEGNV